MPTAEEHLKQDVGSLITSLIFQNSLLKSENDRLRDELAKHAPARETAPTLVNGGAP